MQAQIMQGIIFCTQCGTQLDELARFCIACGKPVGADPAPPHYVNQSASSFTNGPHLGGSAASPPRRLRKIIAAKKISGVCAGFAEFFDIDVTLMRIIWVALLLLPPHIGLIAYVVSAFVLPKG